VVVDSENSTHIHQEVLIFLSGTQEKLINEGSSTQAVLSEMAFLK